MSDILADQLREALSQFPQAAVERFIERVRVIAVFSSWRPALPTRRARINALKKAHTAAKAFRKCLEECIPYLDAVSESLSSAAQFAELAEQAGGIDVLLAQFAEGWRPPGPPDAQLEDAITRGAYDEVASILKDREPKHSDLHMAWTQAHLGVVALSTALKDEIATTPSPQRGPQPAGASRQAAHTLADVALAFEACFTLKPTKYSEGPFFRVARVLTGLEDPTRQVGAALAAIAQ